MPGVLAEGQDLQPPMEGHSEFLGMDSGVSSSLYATGELQYDYNGSENPHGQYHNGGYTDRSHEPYLKDSDFQQENEELRLQYDNMASSTNEYNVDQMTSDGYPQYGQEQSLPMSSPGRQDFRLQGEEFQGEEEENQNAEENEENEDASEENPPPHDPQSAGEEGGEPSMDQSLGRSVTFASETSPTKQSSPNSRKRNVIKRKPPVPQEEILKQKYEELHALAQQKLEYPEEADDLDPRFLRSIGRLAASRPQSAKARMESENEAPKEHSLEAFMADEQRGRSRPLSAKRGSKGKRPRPKSAPPARGLESINFYDRFGKPDHKDLTRKARYLSDASDDEWEDEPRKEKKPLDTSMRNTSNPDIKVWLKQKEKLVKQKKRAERAKVRQKKMMAQKEEQQKRQRQDLSQVAMNDWMEKKKEEARLLTRQRKENELKIKKEKEVKLQEKMAGNIGCNAHMPQRSFSNLPACGHSRGCCTGNVCHKLLSCGGSGKNCANNHGPPKRASTNTCLCAVKGPGITKGPSRCMCGFAKAQKQREAQRKANLAFTPGAKAPAPKVSGPVRPLSAKPLMARPTSGRPQSAKPFLMRPSSAKASLGRPIGRPSSGRPMSAKAGYGFPKRSNLKTRPQSARAASRSPSRNYIDHPLKKGELEELVKKRMIYGNWASYDNYVNTNKGDTDAMAKQNTKTRSRSKSPHLTGFQKSLRAKSPPRRPRSPSPKAKSFSNARPLSAKKGFRIPSPPRPSRSPMPPTAVRVDEQLAYRLPSPPHSPRDKPPKVVQYRRFGPMSIKTEKDNSGSSSVVRITVVTSNDAVVKTSQQLSTEQNLVQSNASGSPQSAGSMDVNPALSIAIGQNGDSQN